MRKTAIVLLTVFVAAFLMAGCNMTVNVEQKDEADEKTVLITDRDIGADRKRI